MPLDQNVEAWLKQSAATWPQGDTDAPWPEGMARAAVNNFARSNMSAHAKYIDDIGGALVAGGTATALTVASNRNISDVHIAPGFRIVVRAPLASGTGAALAIDGLVARTILKNDGSAIAAGDWSANAILDLVYSSAASALIAENISPRPSQRASFAAHKNGVLQAINTAAGTKITFGFERFDVGGFYNTTLSRWTPPAGRVLLSVSLTNSDTGAFGLDIQIFKNGSLLNSFTQTQQAGASGVGFAIIDDANGSDFYEVFAQSGDGAYNIVGDTAHTWFQGTCL